MGLIGPMSPISPISPRKVPSLLTGEISRR
jgi:hypothetical protein